MSACISPLPVAFGPHVYVTMLPLGSRTAALYHVIGSVELSNRFSASVWLMSISLSVKRSFCRTRARTPLSCGVAMLMIVFFGVTPSLLLAVTMLQHVGLEETSQPRLYKYLYMVPISAIAVPLALALIPDYPLGLNVVFKKSVQELVAVLFTMGSLALITPIIVGLPSSNFKMFIDTALAMSLTALALGAPGLYYIATGFYAFKIKRAIDNALNHVRV